jgi:hypothetical protein
VPPLVRAQGITELVGDVILNCTGGNPTALGAVVPQNNVQVFLNTNVTSRLLAGSTTLTEALLMVDEPIPANQRVCTPGPCTIYGQPTVAGNGINYASTAGIPNVYQGSLAAANSLSWLGVPIDPPGSTGTRIIRITNVRANANQLGVSSTLIPTQIVMFISVTGVSQVAINNPQQTVAYIQNGLTFSVLNGTGGTTSVPASRQQCINDNSSMSTDNTAGFGSPIPPNGRTLTLKFLENFASSFKIRVNLAAGVPSSQNIPGQLYNNESGFFATSWAPGTACVGSGLLNCYSGSGSTVANLNIGSTAAAGLADSGTKLIARFNNVPAGIVLYVTIAQVSGSSAGSTAALISTDANGANGALPNSIVAATSTADGGMAPVTLNNGSGSAVWEVSAVNPLAIDDLRFGVAIAYTANPAANLPGLGASTINGAFAPLSTVTTASSGPIPRFADSSTATASFTINACTTNILFPFLTNQAGFDSGVSIANTSSDPFGTAAQAGPCTLNYYGAPPKTNSF